MSFFVFIVDIFSIKKFGKSYFLYRVLNGKTFHVYSSKNVKLCEKSLFSLEQLSDFYPKKINKDNMIAINQKGHIRFQNNSRSIQKLTCNFLQLKGFFLLKDISHI